MSFFTITKANCIKQYFYTSFKVPFILALIIGCFLFNGIHLIKNQSITSDEASFFNYAIRYLKGQPERSNPRIDNSKMPVSVLNTIPRIIEQQLNPGLVKNDFGNSDMNNGRYVTLLFSVLTLLLVFFWARDLYGINAGLFAAFLFSFCPNNLSNSTYITTDSYAVFMLLLSMYLLWKYLTVGSKWSFVLFSITIALSQLVKQSLFHLYILVPFIIVLYSIVKPEKFQFNKTLLNIFIFIFVNWLIINLGYYFFNSNMQLGEFTFMSSLFQLVQNILPSGIIVPFPEPFITGLDQAKFYDNLGGGINKLSSFGKVTILGNESTGGSFWYYYLVSIWYKTPIGFLIFFGWTFYLKLYSKQSIQKLIPLLFLLFPILYFIIVFSFFYKTQCGIRHIIFIYPLALIFSSQVVLYINSNLKKAIALITCLWVVVSVSFYSNNMYAYTNEFIMDKKTAYLKVGVSNLEFKQGGLYLTKFLESNIDFQYATEKKESGNYIIATDDYVDIFNTGKYNWIQQYKPFNQFNYNYLLIKVP